jgi:hypothetical protein
MKRLFGLILFCILIFNIVLVCSSCSDAESSEYDEIMELYLTDTERVIWVGDITKIEHVLDEDRSSTYNKYYYDLITYTVNGNTKTLNHSTGWKNYSSRSREDHIIYTKETAKVVYIQDVSSGMCYYKILVDFTTLGVCSHSIDAYFDYDKDIHGGN